MEDYSNILWVILVGASIVISIVSKAREKKQTARPDAEQSAEDSYTGGEPYSGAEGHSRRQTHSGEISHPELDSHTIPAPAAPQPEDSWKQVFTEVKSSWEQVFTEVKSTMEHKEHRKLKSQATQSHTAGATQTTANTTIGLKANEADESEIHTNDEDEIFASQEAAASDTSSHGTEGPQEGIMKDFELHKAVVWSEILKPKFDEESN